MQKILLSLLLLGAAFGAQAQTTAPAEGRGGSFTIKGGGAYTGFTGDGASSISSYQFNYFGGLGIGLPVSDKFEIVTEALYSRKGASFDIPTGVSTPSSYRYVLQYVDVPLLARVRAGGLFFEAGPQLGVLIDAQQKQDNVLDRSQLNTLNTLDWGYVGGLGFESASGLGIGARYNGGFQSILKASNALAPRGDLRNSAFQVYVSFTFRDK